MRGGEGADTISGGETGVDADTLEFTTGGVGDGVTITFTGTEAGTFSYAGGGSGTFTEVETVAGSAGGDTIDATAASGPVSIFGGDGRDTISGGTSNDHLDAGAGNDTLDGGAGNDTLTTGSGNDSIAMDRFGGADRVTDFSLTDTDHDGHYDDQIDTSDLTNGQGGPVTAWDVIVTDDGFGNALLTFPEGETLILQGVPPGAMATAAQRHAAGIPCFTAGTLIATPNGEVAVEALRPGDLVTTRDQGPQPVVWTARRHLSAAGLLARPDLVPVRLTPAFTGTGRNLLVSPQHAMLIGRGRDEVLVRAVHLARLDGNQVRRAAGVREVTYVHLMFARHQIITANGTPSESFYPGPCSLAMLEPGALVSLARAFPRLGVSGAAFAYGPTARPVLRMADLPPTLNAVLAGQGLRAAQFAC